MAKIIVGDFTEPKQSKVFCYLLIVILGLGTLGFSYIAIKNSKPIDCNNIVYTEDGKSLCIIELEGELSTEQVHRAIQVEYGKQPFYR